MWGLICTHELDGYNCPIDVLLYNCPIYVRCLTFCFILCDTPNRRLLATDVTVKLGWSKLAHNAFQTILTIITECHHHQGIWCCWLPVESNLLHLLLALDSQCFLSLLAHQIKVRFID